MAVVNEQHGAHKWVQIHSVILLRFDFRTKTKENRCNEVCWLRSSFFCCFCCRGWSIIIIFNKMCVCARGRKRKKAAVCVASVLDAILIANAIRLLLYLIIDYSFLSNDLFACVLSASLSMSVCMWFIFIKFMFAPLEWWKRELIAEKWPGLSCECAQNHWKNHWNEIKLRRTVVLFYFHSSKKKFQAQWLFGRKWAECGWVCVLFSFSLFVKITTSFVAIFNTICTYSWVLATCYSKNLRHTPKTNQLAQLNMYTVLCAKSCDSIQFNLRCSCLRNLRQRNRLNH